MNNVLLIFVVWAEVTSASTVYRYKDVISQTGKPAFIVYNFGYLFGQLIGIVVAHVTYEPGYGAAAGIGLYLVCTIIAIVLAKDAEPLDMRLDKSQSWGANLVKRFWNPDSKFGQSFRTVWSRFFYLAFYSVCHNPLLYSPPR
jgi:solute carrier family 6 GABA transporter-like protein 1